MAETKRTPFKIKAGDRLARVRLSLDLDQDGFAELLGASRSQIANYEQGSRTPDPEMMVRLFQKRGVPTDYIYHGDDRMLPNWMVVRIAALPDILPKARRRKETTVRRRATKAT